MKTRGRTLGYVVSAVPTLIMLLTAGLKISHYPLAVEDFAGKFGLSEGSARAALSSPHLGSATARVFR